jgi:cardiolipin synthase A/B
MSALWPLFLSVLAIALMVVASVHAVMTRREVGTAVAWVGVILLSPFLGAALYFLLGVNRIRRRAKELRGGADPSYAALLPAPVPPSALRDRLGPAREHLTQLVYLGDGVTQRPLLPGNTLTPLVEGDAAYPAMLAAIEGAERSVSLTSFIFDLDRAGRRFVEALAAAVERGVEVRVLIDAVGARYSFPSTVGALRRRGVRVARFMPAFFHWRMPYFNLRSHRKIMVVDGRVGFTGGMNIREAFWEEVAGGRHGGDVHFLVEGPVVAELQEAFAQDWTFTTGERLVGEAWFPPLAPVGNALARGIADGPDVDFEKLHTVLLGALAVARKEVRVVTPYFIPDARLLSALAVAARRGVAVTIVLPERVNLILVQWASAAYWATLLEAGCRLLLTPPPFDHAKLLVVDGVWSLVGSANLDPRSLQLNFEFNVEVYDERTAAVVGGLIAERERVGREVSLEEVRGRPFYVKFRNRLARLLSPYL